MFVGVRSFQNVRRVGFVEQAVYVLGLIWNMSTPSFLLIFCLNQQLEIGWNNVQWEQHYLI